MCHNCSTEMSKTICWASIGVWTLVRRKRKFKCNCTTVQDDSYILPYHPLFPSLLQRLPKSLNAPSFADRVVSRPETSKCSLRVPRNPMSTMMATSFCVNASPSTAMVPPDVAVYHLGSLSTNQNYFQVCTLKRVKPWHIDSSDRVDSRLLLRICTYTVNETLMLCTALLLGSPTSPTSVASFGSLTIARLVCLCDPPRWCSGRRAAWLGGKVAEFRLHNLPQCLIF